MQNPECLKKFTNNLFFLFILLENAFPFTFFKAESDERKLDCNKLKSVTDIRCVNSRQLIEKNKFKKNCPVNLR